MNTQPSQPTQINLLFALAVGAALFFAHFSFTKTTELDNVKRRLELEQTKLDQTERTIDKLRNFN